MTDLESSLVIYRAESVGPLLRPPYLLAARDRLAMGGLALEEYRRLEEKAVDHALAVQEECGLDVYSDGEMRRLVFTTTLVGAPSGIDGPAQTGGTSRGEISCGGENITLTVADRSVTDALNLVRSVAADEFRYLRARTRHPVKVTLPSPLVVAKWWQQATPVAISANPFDAIVAAADILREEIADLVELGCTYVQIDAPEIATMVDPMARIHYARQGIDARRLVDHGVKALNSLPAGPSDVIFGLHLSDAGRCLSARAYGAIARQVFPHVPAYDVLLLGFDERGSGPFEPLERTHEHQIIVLGLISSTDPQIESPDEIRMRIMEAAEHVSLGRLAVSCHGGFASAPPGDPGWPDVQRDKLLLVSEVAREVWR
jgi:5-methyltetrahydropteroyltriglutamate--homocysteine methyltransferase